MAMARMYAYTDTGAPTLSGTKGSLKDLLKAILVGSSGIAYGTGGAARPSLGWSIEYESTAKAIFKGAARGTGMMLRVDDDGPGAGSYREAFVRGCEGATDVDTPVYMFPTTAQLTQGQVWRKSNALSGMAVPWRLWGDDIGFYLMIDWYGSPNCGLVLAGDIYSLKNVDDYAFIVGGGNTVNLASIVPDILFGVPLSQVQGGVYTSLVIAQSYDGISKSSLVGVSSNGIYAKFGSTGVGYPAAVNAGMLLSHIEVHELNMYRGILRGCYNLMHTSAAPSPLTTTTIDTPKGVADVCVSPLFGYYSGKVAFTYNVEW